MLTELKIIRNALLRVVVVFVLLLIGFFAVPLPQTGGMSIAESAIEAVRTQLVPTGASLVVLSPLDPFLTQAIVAAALALALTLPLLLFELWRFVAPALTRRERGVLAVGLLSALLLSALGALFAYRILIPLMFRELFAFLPHGVEPFFSLREVLSLVAGFTLGTAVMFLLPLLMVLLSWIGLVPARAWRTHARYAVLLVLIVSAIITPDGSGVGMVLLSLPVCALYGVGYAASTAVGGDRRLLITH